jgi:uncharacterized protein YgiM (DUF1202 family)
MKKNLFILGIIYFSLTSFIYAEDKFPFVSQVTADNVNIRAGYNINFEVIHKLKKNDKLVVIDREFNWYKVELPTEASCFISKKYITKATDSEEGKVNVSKLNVRARPSLKSSVLCQLTKYDKVKIKEGFNKNWYKIQSPKNCYGWVHTKYMKYYSTLKEYEEEKKRVSNLNIELPIDDKSVLKEEEIVEKSKEEKKFNFQQIGTIKKSFSFFIHPSSYKLVQDNRTICYLRTDKATLNSFINLKVKVFGNILEDLRYKYPIVNVEKILVIE